MDVALYKAMNHAITDLLISQQEAVARGLRLWLAGAELKIPQGMTDGWENLNPADQALMAALPRFLMEGPEGTVGILRRAVQEWISSRLAREVHEPLKTKSHR